jgi:heat shock protein HslJ
MRRVALALIVGAFAMGLAACSGGGGTGGPIEGTAWKLTSQLVDGKTVTLPDGVHADARFADGKVAGSGGCNVFTGPATVSEAKLTVGTLASTKMACEGDKASTETAYLANLATAATFTATAEALTIYNGSGAVVLTYAAGPANPLVGEWIVTGYNNGSEAVVSPLEGTELTAIFTGDAVSGNAGCNTYNGGYTLDGDQVAVGPLMTTMMACEDAIMAQEQQFLTALQVPATVEVSGGNVTLRDAAGAMQVTLAPKE